MNGGRPLESGSPDAVVAIVRRARRRAHEAFRGRPRPLPATVVGLLVVVAIGVGVRPIEPNVTTATKALPLVLPVVVVAVVGGRYAAYVVAAASAIAFGLIVPPYGTFRVELAQDLVALVVFTIVAFVVSTVVARRIELLDETERQRLALLRSVSHDFRTPLAAIRAASSELLDPAVHDAAARSRMLELIEQETERLDRLVTNLLDLSRIEAGVLTPRRQSIDLGELVDGCTARLGRLVADLHVAVDIAEDVPSVQADYTQLDQLVTNLLENAARYTPPGGTVQVSIRRRAGSVVLTVADEGPGVPGEAREAVFRTFQAIGVAAGSGVGLAICKAVAEAHGGSISVQDAAAGGAEFVVVLPIG